MSEETRRQQRMNQMQEALDGVLSPEEQDDLFNYLEDDHHEAAQFNQLSRLDNVLRRAPHERAPDPERLAATIMARLQQTVREQLEAEEALDGMPQEAVAVAMALITVTTMPMLIAASWMMIYAQARPDILDRVFEQIIGLLLIVLGMMQVYIEQAERLVDDDPEAAAALLSLIPITMLAVARYILSIETDMADA